MKKLVLFAFGVVLAGNMLAQNCMSSVDNGAVILGFVPNPIVGATEGVAYDETVTIVLPRKVDNTLSPNPGDSIPLCAIEILNPTGLPAGYTYEVWAKTIGTGVDRQVTGTANPDTIGIDTNLFFNRACLRLKNPNPAGPVALIDSVPITIVVHAYIKVVNCSAIPGGTDTFVVKLPIKDAIFVGLEDEVDGNKFAVYSNYPNPAEAFTNIPFSTPSAGKVNLTVYDAVGRVVRNINLTSKAGMNVYQLDTESLQSGIYMYNIMYNNKVLTKKMIVNR